jgi:hypothetical protein
MTWLLTRPRRSDDSSPQQHELSPGRRRQGANQFRPLVERLEDRTLLSNVLPLAQLKTAAAVVKASPQPFTISGTVFRDGTGNGFSSDDAPLKGAVIKLFATLADVNTGRNAVASTTTDDHGAYTFTVRAAGTYYVEELVPPWFVQTGGGSQSGPLGTYYTVKGQPGNAYTNNNFVVYQKPTGPLPTVTYTVTTPGSKPTTVSDLRGHTHPGDMVTVTFTVPAGVDNYQLSLVSYTATGSSFTDSNAAQQRIFDEATGVFAPGKTYSLTVQIPTGYYQIDFVRGPAISQFLRPDAGPDKGNITYHGQDRFITGDNGGTKMPLTPPIQKNDFAAPPFWDTTTQGQMLLTQLNGGPTSTSLSKWLSGNFPHLFGTLADPKNAQEKDLTGLTNVQVGDFFKGLYNTNPTYAEVLAVALAVYATDIGLAGGTYAKAFGLNTSVVGSGLDSLGVGTAGVVLGFAKNSTQTVLNILHGVDQLASSTATLNANLSSVKTLFDGIATGVKAL